MRTRFEFQLNQLNTELILMGALCEDAISCAVKYLIENDHKMKENVAEAEEQINRKMRDIEGLCMRLLIQQQPVATDLRVISSALKMISDMERIGDQAFDISEIAESFVKKDVEAARAVVKMDDEVDDLFIQLKNELIEAIRSNKEDAEALVDLLMIAKYFERIGDHAVNIAQWVIYAIIGEHE